MGASDEGGQNDVELVNVAHVVDGHPADAIALISRNQQISYGELRDQIDRMRGGLAGLGIGMGDRVALLCGNGHPFVIAYLAAVGLGAAVAPLNPASPAPELQRELAVVAAQAVVVDRSAAAAWAGVDREAVPTVHTGVSVDGDAGHGAIPVEDLLAAEPRPAVDVAPDHLAALLFTSGTAGAPRAAMLTHGNLLANVEQSRSVTSRVAPGDVVYGVIPLYHIFGLNVVLTMSLANGATIVLVQRFDPATALESIKAREVSVIPGAPAMWTAFAHFE
ncbi:MAG: AMP-binding protein, partial [Ilumatobacteraceae bacterium]